MTLLRVEGLETAYGDSQVLFGISLEVNKGEVVALLGRNGAGKTTTLSSIMGLVLQGPSDCKIGAIPNLPRRLGLCGRRLPPVHIADSG
jgi:branched-chain amino acid transport system ATP-binding protein